MSMEYIIYTDESVENGPFYSNFYGGALIKSTDLQYVQNILQECKTENNIYGEAKWTKVSTSYFSKYCNLIDRLFTLVRSDKIKLRIMFTHNLNAPINLSKYHHEHKYHLLYYQFIKNAFGLQHSNNTGQPIHIRLYLDRMPSNKEKKELFKSYIFKLGRNPAFRKAKIQFNKDQITEVISHDHVIMQYLDIVLGAMQFRLNNLHREKPAGARRRGQKTIAKERLYKHILHNIREIYPNFNIGINTGRKGGPSSTWEMPYRHWRFVPAKSRIEPSYAKPK